MTIKSYQFYSDTLRNTFQKNWGENAKYFLPLKQYEEPHFSHGFLGVRPPQRPITVKLVTRLIAHALLSDRAHHYLTLGCSNRHGRTPLCICVCVSMCLVSTLQRTHTLRTDTDGLSRNSSSRLCLLRGGEGKSGKINKTSLQFILFLFQNKQSDGGENRRGFRGRYIIQLLWSEEFGSRKRHTLITTATRERQKHKWEWTGDL